MFSGNTLNSGRLGNIFLGNFTLYLLSIKYNAGCFYQKRGDQFQHLGIDFKDDRRKTIKNIVINDEDIKKFFENKISFNKSLNYHIENSYCQDPKIINHIVTYFRDIGNLFCQNIIQKNKFKARYNNNNDLFIHIRAGDIFDKIPLFPSLDFYENVISLLKGKYDKIYLSSDNVSHETCVALKEKYPVSLYIEDVIDTLHFASTCKYIIISSGSFSFLIALFAFFSENVFFNKFAGEGWHPQYYPTLKSLKYIMYE